MALDVQYISLDISKRPTPQQVRLGQGDANGTQLVASIFDSGVAYSLANYSVRLSMHLPGSDTYYGVDGTRSGNVATFNIDETYAATSYGADGFGYVDVMNGDTVICSTSRFQLVVLRSAEDDADPSTSYSNGIREATERAIAAAEAAEGVVLQDVPLMSATIRGGAQLGTGLEITDGVLSVDVSDVASGQLPIAHGGTGASTAAAALTALGAASQDDMDDAEQAIADNAAAIATLGESVSNAFQGNTGINFNKGNTSERKLMIRWYDTNSGSDSYGHYMSFGIDANGVFLYDSNAGAFIWRINKDQ